MAQVLTDYQRKLTQEKMPAGGGKKKVLQAALKLFAKHGFHATTTAQIAQQAGVSEGTIYKYFHSKDDLFRTILMPIIDSVKQDFFAQLSQFDNLDELITFAIKNRLAFLQKNIDLIKILLQEILVGQEAYSICSGCPERKRWHLKPNS